MNLIKYLGAMFAVATMTAVLPSCTNLDEITYDRIDASAYYQDENSVKGAVASIYASAQRRFPLNISGISTNFRQTR